MGASYIQCTDTHPSPTHTHTPTTNHPHSRVKELVGGQAAGVPIHASNGVHPHDTLLHWAAAFGHSEVKFFVLCTCICMYVCVYWEREMGCLCVWILFFSFFFFVKTMKYLFYLFTHIYINNHEPPTHTHKQVIAALLSLGADINRPNAEGATALHEVKCFLIKYIKYICMFFF